MRRIKTPINQIFADGIIQVYQVVNKAEAGLKPKYDKQCIYNRVPFGYKTSGIKRKLIALQEGVQYDLILNISENYNVNRGNMILFDGKMFKITDINEVFSVYPPVKEISIRRIENINECIE